MKLKNNYFILRHGRSFTNEKGIGSSWPEKGRFPLTEKGNKNRRIQKLNPNNYKNGN